MDQHLSKLRFYENIKSNFFCENNIFTEVVFGTQLSSNEEISI